MYIQYMLFSFCMHNSYMLGFPFINPYIKNDIWKLESD